MTTTKTAKKYNIDKYKVMKHSINTAKNEMLRFYRNTQILERLNQKDSFKLERTRVAMEELKKLEKPPSNGQVKHCSQTVFSKYKQERKDNVKNNKAFSNAMKFVRENQ